MSLTADRVSRPPRRTAYQRRMAAIRGLHRRRYAVQAGVVVGVLALAVRHQRESGGPDGASSVDALCPFGAVETLWTWATTGAFVAKLHPSNLVLGLGLLLSVVVAGNAFCGWVCPLGTVQDVLTWVRRRLHLPTVTLPSRVDRVARLGRFVVLAVVVVVSASTVQLWFAGFDPYVALFSLHWLFEPDLATMWPAWLVLAMVLASAVLVERAWCRYLCPLGAVLSVLGHASILRVRRSAWSCTGCDLCVRPCPVGIDVAKAAPAVSTDCIGCLECVATCPKGGALEVTAAAPWTTWRTSIAAPRTTTSGPVPVTLPRGRRDEGQGRP